MDFKAEYDSTDVEDCLKQEYLYEKVECESPWFDDDDTGLSMSSKKIQKRKKYQKIDNETRLKIVEEVQKNGKLLKIAAEKYNVNYSSAKSIFHVYRKEGRILKKPFKGRSSKTIFQLNNPIVFVTLPTPNSPASISVSPNEKPSQGSKVWQLPPIDSLTLSRQTNKDAGTTSFVSLLHPSSASILQDLCAQVLSNNSQANSPPPKENLPTQEKGSSGVPEKMWERVGNINQDIPLRFNSYPYPYQNYVNCQQQFDNRFVPQQQQQQQQVEQANLRDASYMNNPLFNHWIQSQWKAVNSGL